jgi:hypothetical protein
MEMSDLPQIVHKAVTDEAFRAELIAEPLSCLARSGFSASEEELEALSEAACLLDCPSQSLLDKLLVSAIGPTQVWEAKSAARRYSAPKLG